MLENGEDDGDSLRKLKEDEINEEQLELEDLAPDGGWGWMVLLGMIVVTITMFSTAPCIPIMFGELLEASGQAASAMTILTSVWTLSWSISALFTNVLLKKFSMRWLGVSGALLFSMTHILSAAVTHVYQLTIMFFLQGIGIGVMSTICQANFNAYFVKKRVTLNSAAQIIISIGGTVYPILIGILMETYGFRGTAAIIGALNLHSVFGMMLMHPVQWHLRDPKKVHAERQKSLMNTLAKKNYSHNKFDSIVKNNENSVVNVGMTSLEVTGCDPSVPELQIIEEQTTFIPKKNNKIQLTEENQTTRMIMDLFDFSILKDRTFVIMCFGVSCALVSDVIFTSLLPLSMFNSNYTTLDASMAVTVSCMAEFVSKIFLTIFGMFVHVRAKTILFFAMMAMNIAKLGYFFFDNTLTGIMVSVAIIGAVRVLIFVPQPLVIVENYPVEKYAACFAMFSMINGFMLTTANPIFGIIKDLTNSFSLCQLLLIAVNCVFIVPWGIELGIYYQQKAKHKQ